VLIRDYLQACVAQPDPTSEINCPFRSSALSFYPRFPALCALAFRLLQFLAPLLNLMHGQYTQYAVPQATAIAATAPNVAALCCSSAQPHLPVITRWEAQIDAFLAWLSHNGRNGAPTPPIGFVEFLIRLQTTVRGFLLRLRILIAGGRVAGPNGWCWYS